ncbi:MAG: hypothetical protein HRU37_01945, partial [Roseibacillus sp.]|nr:hypothetical protein [Roseibacillus sp.]
PGVSQRVQPDDLPGATTLLLGEPQSGVLESPQDTDDYLLELRADHPLVVEAHVGTARMRSARQLAALRDFELRLRTADDLRGMPLELLHYEGPINDKGLSHLAGLPIAELRLDDCYDLEAASLNHLKGLPLESLTLRGGDELTG